MKTKIIAGCASLLCCLAGCSSSKEAAQPAESISGIYPRLAYYNNEGECGTGAVVPWAGKLWVITYAPHMPHGSSDKLYIVSPDYRQTVYDKSIGGTPANRMIHRESNQLFIGPYVVDSTGHVRGVIPWQEAPGRYTGNARHLTDPANKLYIGTMEEGLYEVDVHSLKTKTIFVDGNEVTPKGKMAQFSPLLPGVHGKGIYSGQGVVVYSNNGEDTEEALRKFDVKSGSLSEWDGKKWTVVRRNQFTEVTGPGGIYGNAQAATDPIWTNGWDHKSLLVGVRDAQKGWAFYRLPKASHSYDGAHGWNTEWPRIRDVGTAGKPDYLMTMHGMFWTFPQHFTAANSAGIRPRSAYLKVIGDFARWQDRLVFGCDDSANKEFLNKRKAKGNIEGPGQSNSNLWFTSVQKPYELGPATAEGAVWMKETVKAGTWSEPFLFAGWDCRTAWIQNDSRTPVTYTFEVDKEGHNAWTPLKSVTVEGGKACNLTFADHEAGEWVRVKTDKDVRTTLSFSYTTQEQRPATPDKMFAGLTPVDASNTTGGLLYGLGNNRRALGLLATATADGKMNETGYYEMNDTLQLVRKDDAKTAGFIREKFAIPTQVITIDKGSVLVVDDSNRRWRLPLGDAAYESLTNQGRLRICREVATERDLFSCMGTFYELPAENADGYAKIRPISSHRYRINDYASYRGMLVMTGVTPADAEGNPHVIVSKDGKAAVWAGVIDDLWSLGKPVGHGGPWKDTQVKKGVPSDPYLIAFYDQKSLTLSHNGKEDVTFTIEADPTGCGDWMVYQTPTVKAGETWNYTFPKEFQARWIRFTANKEVKATAWLEYK